MDQGMQRPWIEITQSTVAMDLGLPQHSPLEPNKCRLPVFRFNLSRAGRAKRI